MNFEDEGVLIGLVQRVTRLSSAKQLTIGGPITFSQTLTAIKGSGIVTLRWMGCWKPPGAGSDHVFPSLPDTKGHQLEVLRLGGTLTPTTLDIVLSLPHLVSLDMSRCIVSTEWVPECSSASAKLLYFSPPTGVRFSTQFLAFLKYFDTLQSLRLANIDLNGMLPQFAGLQSVTNLSIESCDGYSTEDVEALVDKLELRKLAVTNSSSIYSGYRRVPPVLHAELVDKCLKQPQLEELLIRTPLEGELPQNFNLRCKSLTVLSLASPLDENQVRSLRSLKLLELAELTLLTPTSIQALVAIAPRIRNLRITIQDCILKKGELSVLSSLKQLKSVSVTGNLENVVEDLSVIGSISTLVSLRLRSTVPGELPPDMSWSKNLQVLDVDNLADSGSLDNLLGSDQLLSLILIDVDIQEGSLKDPLLRCRELRRLRLYRISINVVPSERELRAALPCASIHVQ